MILTIKIALASLATALMALGAMYAIQNDASFGGAPAGLATTQTLATTTVVGPSVPAVKIFTSNPGCTSRTISTNERAIVFTTGEPTAGTDFGSLTITNSIGLIQAASTTVVYDGGLTGCGQWSAYAITSTTLTVTEYK